jgi:colanic acid biosynthesis protein WcaH
MKLSREDFIAVVRDTPLVSIDLVVRDPDGRVLLGLRRNEPARGCWFVPGGRITKDEKLADAFRRLCREELNIDRAIGDAAFVGVYEHFYDTNFTASGEFGTHYVVLAYSLTLDAAPTDLPAEQHERYRWFAVEAIRGNDAVHAHTRQYFGDSQPGR